MTIGNIFSQFWDELVSRPDGPLAMRFVLQPLVASVLAVRDGMKDERDHRRPYLWTILSDPSARRSRLGEGLKAVSRVLILAVVLDLAYQVIALGGVRPLQTIVIALVLAFLPYLLLRGPAARIAHMLRHGSGTYPHRG